MSESLTKLVFLLRSCKSTVNCFCFETFSKRRTTNAEVFRPLRKCFRFASPSDKSVISFVVRLLLPSSPANVTRSVSKLVFNAIQRVTVRWTFTDFGNYITNKSRSVMPSGMKLYSTPTIYRVKRCFRIVTTIFNVVPQPKDIIGTASMFCMCIVSQTSTRLNTTTQISSSYIDGVTAIAKTLPNCITTFVEPNVFNRFQTSKLQPGKLFNWHPLHCLS